MIRAAPIPRRPDHKSLQAEATTCRDPGSVDCPGFFYVAVNAFFLAQQTFPRCVPQQPHCSFIRIPGWAMDGADDIVVTNGWVLRGRTSGRRGRNMTASDTPNSAAEQKRAERLDVARRVYHALAAQDADRVITLCDIRGRLIARHDLRPEEGTQSAS